MAATILTWLSTGQAMAQDVTDLCSRATMTAAVGPISAETSSYRGVDRHDCTYTSSLIGAGTQHPLVIALHGGNGNASQMMGDARRIIEHAEAMGWIAVFPNGLPRPSCGGASPCLNNSWGAPDNVFFIAELISRLKAGGQGTGRPCSSDRVLRRRQADLRDRRDAGLSARDPFDRDGRRGFRALPRGSARGRILGDPARPGHAGQRASRPGWARPETAGRRRTG
jgi:hypothetical protein